MIYIPTNRVDDKKKVWLTPMSNWLRTDLKDFALQIISPDYCLDTKKYFNFIGINKIFNEHINRKKYNLNLIWAIIVFQIWYKNIFKA